MSKVFIKESVRSLVEFILKSGSIDNRFTSKYIIDHTKYKLSKHYSSKVEIVIVASIGKE